MGKVEGKVWRGKKISQSKFNKYDLCRGTNAQVSVLSRLSLRYSVDGFYSELLIWVKAA